MKNKKSLILLLSVTSLTALIGSSAFISQYEYSYVDDIKTAERPVAYIIGTDKQFTSLEKALSVAKSGDIVTLIPPKGDNYSTTNTVNTTEKATYEVKKPCTIPEGVTLIIPTDSKSLDTITNQSTLDDFITSMNNPKKDRTRGNNSSYAQEATNNKNRFLRVTLKLKKGVTLTNNGTLVVSGYLGNGSNTSGLLGQTSHSYSEIVLEEGAGIIQDNNNATIHCYGFINEEMQDNSSFLDLKAGTLNVPFIVRDYRGVMFSWAMPEEAIQNYHVSPFNQFEVKNISCLINIFHGSQVLGVVNFYVKLTVGTLTVDENFNKWIYLIGTSSDYFIQTEALDKSRIVAKYNSKNDSFNYKFYGNFKLNSIKLKLSYSIVNIDLDTINAYFPISYKYTIELFSYNNQSSLFNTQNQKIKFLPGSTLIIHDNVKLIAPALVVMTGFYDGIKGNNLSNEANDNKESTKYPLKEGAICILENNAYLECNELAGYIYSNNSNNIVYSSDTSNIYEAWDYQNSGNVTPPTEINSYLILKEKLQVIGHEYFYKKKIFVNVNSFLNCNSYVPKAKIILNNNNSSSIEEINNYQKIIFCDDASSNGFLIEPLDNIYMIKDSNAQKYNLNSSIPLNDNNNIVCLINSNLNISSDNQGVNEFYAQSVTVRKKVESANLYLGNTLELQADVVDINKIYDKTIVWESSNPNIISVDQNGVLTGLSYGTSIITATCNGISDSLEIEVTNDTSIVTIDNIYLTDNYGNTTLNTTDNTYTSKEEHSKNTDVMVTLNIVPENAEITKIQWKFQNTSVNTNKQFYYYEGDQKIYIGKDLVPAGEDEFYTLENINVNKVGVIFDTASMRNPDEVRIACIVTGYIFENGKYIEKTYEATAIIIQKADLTVCLTPEAIITLFDGSKKMVKDIKKDDYLLAYNHFEGKFEKTGIMFDAYFPLKEYDIINLSFDNGSKLKIASGHGLFNLNRNRYEIYYKDEFINHIGEDFVCVQYVDGKFKLEATKLIDVKLTKEEVIKLTPISEYHLNCIANDILTLPDDVEGMFYGYKYKSLKENLQIDMDYLNELIKKYGIYKYEDVKDVVAQYFFDTVNVKYFKTFIGMGYMSYKEANHLINSYMKAILEYHNLDFDFKNKKQLTNKN